ncbi:MAG TPA: glycosyltransferase family 39 protein [Gaiellaceae bacterium]|nr:glycosyltransferase family 39 protein [Gaiellaceae bacterium]
MSAERARSYHLSIELETIHPRRKSRLSADRGEPAGRRRWPSGRISAHTAAAAALAVAGIALRLVEYGLDRSLWLDEALLSLNLRNRGLGELLGTLDYTQAAPPGYLVLEKLAVSLFGDSELALRSVAIAAAVLSVPLFWIVARRILAPWAAVLALGIFAFTGPLLMHAGEVKPYSSDVFFATLLLALVLMQWRWGETSIRRTLVAGLIAAAVVAFSYPAIFVVAGIGATVLVDALLRRDWRVLRPIVAAAVVGLAGLAALAVTALDTTSNVRGALEEGSSRFYMPFPPTSRDDLGWFPHAASSFFRESLGLWAWAAVLFAGLAIAGAISLARKEAWRTLALLLSPLPFLLAASALERYPIDGRFTLFYVPFAVLLVAEGAWAIGELLGSWMRGGGSRRARASAAAAVACWLAALVGIAAAHAGEYFSTSRGEAIKPALSSLQRDWRPGDTLYLFYWSQYAFRYYAQCGECGVAQRTGAPASLWGSVRLVDPAGSGDSAALASSPPGLVVGIDPEKRSLAAATAQLDGLDGTGRLWALFTHVRSAEGANELAALVRRLDGLGTRLSEQRFDGAVLFLYDLGSD